MDKFTGRILTKVSRAHCWGLSLGLVCSVFVQAPAQAQDLQAELDALDSLPADDLGGFDPSSNSAYVPDASEFEGEWTEGSDVAEAIGRPEANNAQEAAPPAQLEVPVVRELGVGDLDLQGLEQELNFDSFQDGGKLSVEQLNQVPQTNFSSGTLGKVTGLDFQQLADRVRLVVSANRPIDWSRELRSQRRQVIVEMRNMELSKDILKRALDTGEFEGPVAFIQAFPAKVGSEDSVKVLFQLRSFVDPTVLRTGNELVIDFPIVGGDTLFRTRTASRIVVPKTYLSPNDIREFKGAPINLNVKEADLGDVLKFLSLKSGKNFVLSKGVTADTKVTVGLNGVPWDQALSIILFNQGLGFQDLENVYRIATTAELQQEVATAVQAAEEAKKLTPLETRLIPLSYATGADVQANIGDFLTQERGKASVEERTNTLVVTDLPEVLEKVERYVREIDKQTPQVLIEARIVEAREGFNRNRTFGMWTAYDSTGSESINSGQNIDLNFGSNVDNEVTDPATSVFGFIQELGNFGQVDFFLQMQESKELSRTIASPRITVLNNETANINQGSQIRVNRRDESGNVVTEYIPVTTSLDVTPQVTSDGFVTLDLTLARDILEGNTGQQIGTRSAKTKMLVENGSTAMIGGLYTLDKTDTEAGLPWLKDVPIIGTLFTNTKVKTRTTNELLMFISPRIVNRKLSQILGSDTLSKGNFSASKPNPAAR